MRRISSWWCVLALGCGTSSDRIPEGDGDTDSDSDTDSGSIPLDDEHAGDFLFDESEIRIFELEVAADDWTWLEENARLEQYVPATLVFDGTRYEGAAVRYKGGYGALQSCFDAFGNRTCDKLSMKVSFNEYDPEGRFFGLKKLQFHSMNKDPSQMRERIAYGLFREMGVETCRTAYARVRVNGEELGLFVLVEQIDGRFTRRHFEEEGGEGNLYKEIWPENQTEAAYVTALETNEDVGDVSGITAFEAELAAAADADFLDVFGRWTDLDSFYDHLAVARGISHWDDITAFYCPGDGSACFNHNYFWYESEAKDRIWFVPWDMDHSLSPSPWETWFGVPPWREPVASCDPVPIFLGIGVLPATCDPLLDRMATLGWSRYVDSAGAFLDGPFQEDLVLARIDEAEDLVETFVAADENGPGLDAFRTAVAELRAYVPTLRDRLETEIGR